ncbi:MAG: hypothetical protein ACI8PZ_006454 [Myxococcota bacterium]
MLALLATAAAVASSWTVDLSSLWENHGAWPVQSAGAGLCYGLAHDHALAIAPVIYAKKGGVSSWGHASIRVLACVAGELHDYEYEAYKFGPDDRARLAEALGPQPFLEDRPYLRSQRGRLLRYRNEHTVDRGWYGDALAHNREIYELWLPLGAEARDAMWHSLDTAWSAQLDRLHAREPIGETRYHWWSTNCTLVHQESLLRSELTDARDLSARQYPFALLRALEGRDGAVQVVHPSPDLLARLVRRSGSVEALVADVAVGPLEVERGRRIWRAGRRRARAAEAALEHILPSVEPLCIGVARSAAADPRISRP